MALFHLTPSTPVSLTARKRQQRHWLGAALTAGAIIGLSAVGILVSRTLVNQSQELGSKAAPTTTLSLQTPQTNLAVGQTFTVNINANTGTNIVKALDVNLQYDPSVLQLLDITKGPWLAQAQPAIKTIDQTKGSALFGLIILPTANPAYVVGQGTAMVATFKALAPIEHTTIAFNTTRSLAGAAKERQNVVTSYASLALVLVGSGTNPTANPNSNPTTAPTTPPATDKQCNETCTITADCGNSLICYGGRCRRDQNLNDPQCTAPADAGLNRSCNQYCANDGECGGGLKCWYNQCRLPQNLTDASCKVTPASTPQPTRVAQPTQAVQTTQPTRAATRAVTAVTKAPPLTTSPTAGTGTKATASARIVIDAKPSSTPPPKVTKTNTVADFPTAPTAIQPNTQPSTSAGGIPSWLATLAALAVVGVAVVLVGLFLKSMLANKPKAQIIPPKVSTIPTSSSTTATTTPGTSAATSTLAPAQASAQASPPSPPTGPQTPQSKVHFGTPVDFGVLSKQTQKNSEKT